MKRKAKKAVKLKSKWQEIEKFKSKVQVKWPDIQVKKKVNQNNQKVKMTRNSKVQKQNKSRWLEIQVKVIKLKSKWPDIWVKAKQYLSQNDQKPKDWKTKYKLKWPERSQ